MAKFIDETGNEVIYTPTKKRPGDDPAYISKKEDNIQKRADFVKENAEYYKKTPAEVVNTSSFKDARNPNDMRPTNPQNLQDRENVWKTHDNIITPGKWRTK